MLCLLLSADNELDAIARAQARAGTKLAADAALSQAAQCLVKIGRSGRALSTAVTRFCADGAGVYDAVLLPLLGQTSEGQDLTDTLERFFRNEAKSRALTHYGAASIKGGGTKALALLASMRRGELLIEQAKDHVDFHASVAPGHKMMRAVVTDPRGVVEAVALSNGKGTISIKHNGRYQLEILADAKDGPHVVANRVIFAGVQPPKEPPAEGAANHEPLEARMLTLMNQARAKVGAAPLTINTAVSKVALAHAKDMKDKGYFAHHSATGATLGDRLKQAKIGYLRASENLSAAPTADDAHESLMGSPGHRKNILDPLLAECGIGVVASPLSGGDPSYLFVIDFITQAKATTVKEVREAILTAINQARAQSKLSPLKLDGPLSNIADQQAQMMSDNDELGYVPSQEEFFARAHRVFNAERFDSDLFVTNDPTVVRKSQNTDKPAIGVGIGVATSESKRFGSSVHWVTVVYGR